MSKETGALRQSDASRVLPSTAGKDFTPKYFRELVRLQYADSNLKRLHEIAQGETKFPRPVVIPGGGKGSPPRVEWHEVEADAMVQVLAAKALIEVAIPKQMGLVDGDDKGTGVIWMPALERADTEDAEFEVVEEEIGPDNAALSEDRDVAPPALASGSVPPDYVRAVLAKRRNGKNGAR